MARTKPTHRISRYYPPNRLAARSQAVLPVESDALSVHFNEYVIVRVADDFGFLVRLRAIHYASKITLVGDMQDAGLSVVIERGEWMAYIKRMGDSDCVYAWHPIFGGLVRDKVGKFMCSSRKAILHFLHYFPLGSHRVCWPSGVVGATLEDVEAMIETWLADLELITEADAADQASLSRALSDMPS